MQSKGWLLAIIEMLYKLYIFLSINSAFLYYLGDWFTLTNISENIDDRMFTKLIRLATNLLGMLLFLRLAKVKSLCFFQRRLRGAEAAAKSNGYAPL